MKFIHIADVHLGAVPDSNMPWGVLREKEIWSSFQNIIQVCNREKADLLLIAGDLFHRQPLIRELKEVNYYFSKLETAQVVIMAGNHDYISARSGYQGFEWDKRVHMFLKDHMEVVEFPELHTKVYGFSYHARDIKEPLYDTVKPDQDGMFHILLAHCGDEKDIPINRKKMQEAGFDYIALGHIHKPEEINNRMAYSGSLEPLDKTETGERGYILGNITMEEDKQVTSIRFIPASIRQYKEIKINVDSETTNGLLADRISEVITEHGKQHIYSIRIQGIRNEIICFDREAIQKLGNVLEVDDQSVPDYDFDALYRENADNLIGMFIQRIKERSEQDETVKKALYYGMEALLGARN